MADTIFGNGNDQWVCPNDRQLALRAKYGTAAVSVCHSRMQVARGSTLTFVFSKNGG